MKTKKTPRHYPAAVLLLALLPLVANASENAPAAPEQKDSRPSHVLFTGTDIRVLRDGILYRVRGVDGDAFIIKVKDREVKVPMGTNPEKLKLAKVQALTERSATMANFKYDRTYTAANDPFRKAAKGMLATIGMQEYLTYAENKLITTPKEVADQKTGELRPNPDYVAAEEKVRMANQSAGGNMGSFGYYADEMSAELGLELYDAVEVQFQVSSEKPINDPYVVIMAKYHEKDDPKHSQNWLFAKSLPAIGSEPRKMTVTEGGFPPGFVIDKLQVHLYENGQEIATDLSENRAPLTRDETHEYLVIEYVSTHKNATRPPEVALSDWPDDWAMHKSDRLFQDEYHVKVDPTGNVAGVFADKACTKAADAYYAAALGKLRFLPALEKGKPVAAVIAIKPAGLTK